MASATSLATQLPRALHSQPASSVLSPHRGEYTLLAALSLSLKQAQASVVFSGPRGLADGKDEATEKTGLTCLQGEPLGLQAHEEVCKGERTQDREKF